MLTPSTHARQVIAKAKVPIIKFEDPSSSFSFDISFDVANGPVAAGFVSTLMHQLPAMRPLVLVLKIFLQQREFNEVCPWGAYRPNSVWQHVCKQGGVPAPAIAHS